MDTSTVTNIAKQIMESATPVIRIMGVGGRRWKRNVANGSRIGPWLQGNFEIVDEIAWRNKGACLYLVAASDSGIRYVGISRNGLNHRWRTSPAFDAETMMRLPVKQLFHSQCWKHIEHESQLNSRITFEVRVISSEALLPVLARLGSPLSAFLALRDDGESVVAGVERWLCNHRNEHVASWNVAMSGR